MSIKFYRVDSVDGYKYTAYYCGYNLENVKHVAYSDTNSQLALYFTEIEQESVPFGQIVITSRLNRNDRRMIQKWNDDRKWNH